MIQQGIDEESICGLLLVFYLPVWFYVAALLLVSHFEIQLKKKLILNIIHKIKIKKGEGSVVHPVQNEVHYTI